SALLLHRIRQMPDLPRKVTGSCLRRHFQTLTVNVEQPAMIGTTDAPIFNVTVFQRGAAMRTVFANQTKLASLSAKQHQLFAQDFDSLRNVMEIARRANHHPVAAKPFAGRRAKTNVWNVGESDFLQTFH